jgi:hypothetical protein
MAQGYYPGIVREQLKDRLYFTIDSEAELETRWPVVRALRPDFIKINLWSSEEFDTRRADARYVGMRGLDPALVPKIVMRAKRDRLRVSAHINNAADFHNAVVAGVDEIVHSGSPSPFNTVDNAAITLQVMRNMPGLATLFVDTLSGTAPAASTYRPIAAADARLAAERGIVVVTTIQGVGRVPENRREIVRGPTAANLRILRDNGVTVVIGSDDVTDTSVREFTQMATLGVWDNVSLLRMWTETTPRAIFPDRRIGELRDGFEANFVALAGDPISDLSNLRRITLRLKQGVLLSP